MNRRQQVRITSALSDWASFISGVHQGSGSGPILLILFINDLPKDTLAKLFLFADDTKVLQVLFSAVCLHEIQSDMDHLTEWSDKWQLKFNTSKCKVIHIGPTNTSSHAMLDLSDDKHKELEFIEKGKDLGVVFDNNLKFSSHIINQVNKPNQVMGLIRRSYTYLDENFFRYLFNALVRQHLEYCASVWYPLLKKGEELIENVLCRASNLIPRISNFSYPYRLTFSKSRSSCFQETSLSGCFQSYLYSFFVFFHFYTSCTFHESYFRTLSFYYLFNIVWLKNTYC